MMKKSKFGKRLRRVTDPCGLITLKEAANLEFVRMHRLSAFRLWTWTSHKIGESGLLEKLAPEDSSKKAVLKHVNIGSGAKNKWIRTKEEWVKDAFETLGIND